MEGIGLEASLSDSDTRVVTDVVRVVEALLAADDVVSAAVEAAKAAAAAAALYLFSYLVMASPGGDPINISQQCHYGK